MEVIISLVNFSIIFSVIPKDSHPSVRFLPFTLYNRTIPFKSHLGLLLYSPPCLTVDSVKSLKGN